jgi:hypothetical protein
MNLFTSKLITIISAVVILFTTPTLLSAQELNLNGFSGTMSTTITSGVTVRTEDNNCLLQDGYNYTRTAADMTVGGAGLLGTKSAALQAAVLSDATKNGAGCATARTDSYGNTSTNHLAIGDVNSDDGKLNFPNSGEIIDQTTKFFTTINGKTDSGLSVGISLIGNYNPVLDLNAPNFKQLTNAGKSELESDLQIVDAYVAGSADFDDNYLDYQIGRFVTSWGEATFLPIGMNGLVTNAVDLTKLRAPGASIRDALLPTEQISLSTQLGNGSFEAYYQLGAEQIKTDPMGAFYGSEVLGTGGNYILASAPNSMEANRNWDSYCTYAYNEIGNAMAGNACNAASAAEHSGVNGHKYQTTYLAERAGTTASEAEWGAWLDLGQTKDFGSLVPISDLNPIVSNGLVGFTNTDANAGTLANVIHTAAKRTAYDFNTNATVFLRVNKTKFVNAKDDGQFGMAYRTYLDSVGDGLDLGFYYANYHSKVPYLQIVGAQGILAGDFIGMYDAQATGYLTDISGAGPYNTVADGDALAVLGKNVPDILANDTATANDYAALALLNGAMSSGVCGGFTAMSAAPGYFGTSAADGAQHQADKNASSTLHFGVDLGTAYANKIAFDSTRCDAAGDGDAASTAAFITYGATLLPAITPLNEATYQFVYPEDMQIMGASFNTNVAGTMINGELTLRPDFPLATSSGDQINAIGDASGATAALAMFGAQSYPTSAPKMLAIQAMKASVDAVLGSGQFESLLINTKRSSLPTPVYSITEDYTAMAYHTDMDVWALDLGTTSTFAASHPITSGIGADSAVLLTELGVISIDGMDNKNKGFVARSGFNEGAGEFLCLGMYQDLTATQLADINTRIRASGALGAAYEIDYDLSTNSALSNLGSGIVDALFGNGSYCESQMGADDLSATYRVIGSATYNNFNNSAWSASPNFAWAHDFMGYGPSSLGGFVPGKQSLSLGVNFSKGSAVKVGLNYVAQMGDITDNTNADKDYLSANFSYAF